jgi:hypothetical protein
MGAEELVIRWGNLARFKEDLEKISAQAGEVETYAKEQVFDRSGFDYDLCVLKPLADMMTTLGGTFGDLRTTFDSRWDDLVAALEKSVNDLADADEAQGKGYERGAIDLDGQG